MGSVAGLLGGALAATSFATKASTRAAVNTSPEPFSNIAVSLAEDGAVLGMMWLATNYPITFGITLCIVLVLSIWLVIILFKYLKAIYRRISGWLAGDGMKVTVYKNIDCQPWRNRMPRCRYLLKNGYQNGSCVFRCRYAC
jgi:hypothetical protein